MRLAWFDRNGKNTAVLGDRSKSDTPRKAGGLIGIGFHLVSLRILGIFLMGNVPFQPLSLGSGGGLLIGNFPNEGRHPHTLRDRPGSSVMHRGQKLAAGAVNGCDLRYIDFDFLARAQRRAPNIFRFADPRAGKSACELQAAWPAFLMKHDS